MYYKMRILPVIFLFSMMTKAQDNFILGFLIHGVNLILNKGMTGIWIARRYLLFSAILEFLFDDKFDTGYFSTSFNRIKFNSYIGQFVDF